MVKFLVKMFLQFFFWKPKDWRKGLKAKLESRLYSIAIRRRAKKCGRNLYILGVGVNVTDNTTIGDGVGFGKNVKIWGDGPVTIGKRAVIAEDSIIYTQVHDYDHSTVLPFGWGFTYPETRIDDYAWIGLKSIILPGAHIGEGAIVQAGSVVMGKIPPCSIAAGNPAKVIGWRDVEHYNALKREAGEPPVEILQEHDTAPARAEAGKAAASAPTPADTSEAASRLDALFCRVFAVSPSEVKDMSYKTHPAWDSAGHMALVAAIEQEFKTPLSPKAVYTLRSYADALKLVASIANAKPSNGDVTPIFNLDRDGVAVVWEGREVSYRELAGLADRAAAGLKPHTVKIVINGQDLDTVAIFVGCVNRGITPLMLPESIDGELLEKLRTVYEGKPTAPELAVLLTTSGSTGSPKLVRLSRKNISEDNRLSDKIFDLDASVRMTMVLPICYAWGLSVACAVLEAGGTLVMTRKTVMDAGLADVMLDARATHFAGVPYMYEVLDRLRFFDRDFPALKGFLLSGGALPPALRRKFALFAKERGFAFSEGYGQTETTGVMSTIRTDLMPERIGSIGKAGGSGAFRVDDGELIYEGPIVAMGYAVCAEDLLKGDEWKGVRRTGDLATIDAEGYVTLSGRASRFLKIFGNRVSLDEVENLVKDHFAGVGCAATGADGDLRVFVTSATAEEVEKFLVAKLHFNATVMKVRTIDAIPLNANGKTDYPRLKEIDA